MPDNADPEAIQKDYVSLLVFKAQALIDNGLRTYKSNHFQKSKQHLLDAQACIEQLPPESRKQFNSTDIEYHLVLGSARSVAVEPRPKAEKLSQFLATEGSTTS